MTLFAEPKQLWTAALGELELQMTRAIFDTWLRGSTAMSLDPATHTLTVAVKNGYAVEWLSDRLYPPIERTVQRLTGNGTRVAFVVETRIAPPAVIQTTGAQSTACEPDAWTPPDFDPSNTRRVSGWFPIPEYACKFWAPLLGRTAWRVWEIARQADIRTEKTEWTPARRWSAPEIARLVPCGVQAITGRNHVADDQTPGAELVTIRRMGEPEYETFVLHQPGAFDTLQREGVAEIYATGERRHRVYVVSVLCALPLLHPSQVDALGGELQVQHERWVEAHGLDPELW